MANEPANQLVVEGARDGLKSYNLTLPMGSLSIGVDNIHHDVFLSPKFVQVARDYLFDLIRQNTSGTYLSGIEFRNAKPVDSTTFRKLLTELLQSSLGRAKQQKNIEIDLLFRLALLKFLTAELVNQFGNVILDVKEYIRKRGEYFERSQQAHVIKARLSEMQSARRDVLRIIGQVVAQIFSDIEENVIVKARRALFGEELPYYEMLKNRLVFLDGGKDDFYFLEHYVLLGNYSRDPDRLEAMDALFQDFLREAGIRVAPDSAPAKGAEEYRTLFAEAERMRGEIASLEEQRESLRKRLEKGDGLLNKFLSSAADPAEVKASLTDVENRLRHFQKALEDLGPRLDRAKKQAEFVQKDYEGKLGDYLNEPENARRLFDATNATDSERPARAKLLAQLVSRLEQHEMMPHVLASYEIRPIAGDYCPPVHLQQLRKALVSKEEAKRVEEILKQVPAKRLTMKPLEELSKRIRRYSREETQAAVLRFAIDFLRLRRDLRDAEHLAACMERINLVTAEKIRELSRLNNRLYECVLKEEVKSEHDQVVSHVIIKADVRGSTKMTQDLLARGLSPASHFSLNLHEPVKKLLDRYSAKKVFIEGDAIILAIFETEATQGDARPVAKACALAKQMLNVCNSYNDGTSTTHLPPLELGIGIAFQGSAPTYWIDGDARIMISKALNLSDRLSGCAKLAKRMLAGQKTHFSVFQFLTALEGASAEELDEFLVRFNMNGIELNDEGFQKLSEEISLEKLVTKLDMPWAKQDVALYYGEVPMGESVELLVLREGLARELLPGGKIGKPSDHHYYEVCTSPVIYDLAAALKRTHALGLETTRA
jgi:CII-binding regulator of phage lambda lysogenization HflD